MRVSDIHVGKSVGADKKFANQTTTFGVRDTMFVAVVTDGAGKDAKLATKWTYNGKTVKEDSQTISPTGGTTVTNFHTDNKTAWPKGKDTQEVTLNGTSASTKDNQAEEEA